MTTSSSGGAAANQCGSSSRHNWPLGVNPLTGTTACHGWRSKDSTGALHDNSANMIRCVVDGNGFKMVYDQYAGVIDCAGGTGATTKEYMSILVQSVSLLLFMT